MDAQPFRRWRGLYACVVPEVKQDNGPIEKKKRGSDTGTRTRISALRGPCANHLHHIATTGQTVNEFSQKQKPRARRV